MVDLLPDSDRLSELPDSLIFHILSFLPMKDVVSTTVISKRWKNHWKTIPCLNFIHTYFTYKHFTDDENDDEDEPHSYTAVRDFINRALIFWRGTKIQKFKIDFEPEFDMKLCDDIDLWVCFAKENEVEELYIHLVYLFGVYCAPPCIYSCSSLKKLSLVGCELQVNGPIHWNHLKSLCIDNSPRLGEDVINYVLSGCPQLEDFVLCLGGNDINLNIQSTSLKILKVEEVVEFDPETDLELRILCPNLEILNISGVFHRKCLWMNMSLLKDITLAYHSIYDDIFSTERTLRDMEITLRDMLRRIFTAIQHVKRVTLLISFFNVLQVMDRKYLPLPLLSVESLELEFDYIELQGMVNILGIFPKLKLLVVTHSTWVSTSEVPLKLVTNLSKSFLLQLRKVEIFSTLYGNSIFEFVEFLLEHATMLEKMVIRPTRHMSRPQEKLLVAAEKLLCMPRSSPTAKVIFCRG